MGTWKTDLYSQKFGNMA